jgi:hypothetical protein
MVSASDRELLRRLAAQVRAIADQPVMAERRRLWKAHNALKPQRPMVLCFPEGAWGEIHQSFPVECQDQRLRGWERRLRTQIYWWEHLNDDNTVEPWFDVGWHIDWGDNGVEIPRAHGDNRGSYKWTPPIVDLDRDLAKLRFRQPTVDRQASDRDMALALELFGDILPARRQAWLWWTQGLTMTAAFLLGIEEMMLAMYDNPAGLHRLMAFLRDDQLAVTQWDQDQGLITPHNGNSYTGSGGVGYTDDLSATPVAGQSHLRLSDMWGFAESQETVGISPDHFVEFVLPYQLPLLEKFGLNCYGCCEQLDTRIDEVLKAVPRLRRVSVAPLANQQILARKLAGRYIFSRKPDPTKVCVGFNEPGIRAELQQTLNLAGHGPLEMILKDTHTVEHEPWRLGRWVQIAREEVERCISAR